MSGIGMMMLGSGSSSLNATMTVGSAVNMPIFTNIYVDGFIDPFSATAFNTGAFGGIGALTPIIYAGATVKAICWQSTISHAGNGNSSIEVSGNRSAGFITSVTSNGVSLGAIGVPFYDATYDSTTFNLGGSATNPFGTSGTKTIIVK